MCEEPGTARTCQRCGVPLGTDAPEGLCPRCLMALNLATQTDITTEIPSGSSQKSGPGGVQVAAGGRHEDQKPPPPPLDQISKQFPQLEILECLGRGGMGV